jgi:hypothetical protein
MRPLAMDNPPTAFSLSRWFPARPLALVGPVLAAPAVLFLLAVFIVPAAQMVFYSVSAKTV